MRFTITTVSFDGDDTLWDFDAAMRRSLEIVLDELRRAIPGDRSRELTIDTMVQIRDTVAAELASQTVRLEEVRLRAFERTVEHVGPKDDSLAERLHNLYMHHRFAAIELYPDVLATLGALAPRYRIGLLSNGNTYPEKCGLENLFQFVVFAQDVGVAKPDPRIFAHTCELAGCTPGELLHVGDAPETDVVGARNFGAVSVWLNRNGASNQTDTPPDFEIASLAELPALLETHTR